MSDGAEPAPRRREGVVGLDAMTGYDVIIDARSPAEYADDHLPGAINLPVLDNEQRAQVGTLHKQASAFEAKKVGAALVSRNIAQHLEAHFADKPRSYRPLVYCWRGGNRSGAFVTVLRAIGWNAAQLDGGYKAYRRQVLTDLEQLPEQFRFRVICGPTGVGKSRILRSLAQVGAQVLDLEDLAAHMGSVLGAYPDRPQPSQRLFETRVRAVLQGFDGARPVFVESESRKIGRLQTPDALLMTMRAAPCLRIEASIPVRVALLKEEYAHFLADPAALNGQLDCLVELQGRERIDVWKALAEAGDWNPLVAALLDKHYDPAYARSLGRNFPQAIAAPSFEIRSPASEDFLLLARQIVAMTA